MELTDHFRKTAKQPDKRPIAIAKTTKRCFLLSSDSWEAREVRIDFTIA